MGIAIIWKRDVGRSSTSHNHKQALTASHSRRWVMFKPAAGLHNAADKLTAFGVLQLCNAKMFTEDSDENRGQISVARSFLARYKGNWQQDVDTSVHNSWESIAGPYRRDVVLQYHLRVFTVGRRLHRSNASSIWPATLQRVSGTIKAVGNGKDLKVEEKRYAVAIKTTCAGLDLPVWRLINLVDELVDPGSSVMLRNVSWKDIGAMPRPRTAGLLVFAARLHDLCRDWEQDWTSLLDAVDIAIQVDVSIEPIRCRITRR